MSQSAASPTKPRAERRGLMLIQSSPSGAGKSTLTRLLLSSEELDLTLSISVTTRILEEPSGLIAALVSLLRQPD